MFAWYSLTHLVNEEALPWWRGWLCWAILPEKCKPYMMTASITSHHDPSSRHQNPKINCGFFFKKKKHRACIIESIKPVQSWSRVQARANCYIPAGITNIEHAWMFSILQFIQYNKIMINENYYHDQTIRLI